MNKAHVGPSCVSWCHSTSWTFRLWSWMPSGVLVRYHADGWGGILALTLDRSEYHDPLAPSAYGGATSDALDLGIHSACRRTVVESWSRVELGEYQKQALKVWLENDQTHTGS